LKVEDVTWSAQRIPTDVNLGFLDRRRYLFIQVSKKVKISLLEAMEVHRVARG
jgi:hypothetical protein